MDGRPLESQDAFSYAKAHYAWERAKLDEQETRTTLQNTAKHLIKKYKIDTEKERIDLANGLIYKIADESATGDAPK